MKAEKSWKSTALILIGLIVAVPAWAAGFPGGLQEAMGPRFQPAQQFQPPPLRYPVPNAADPASRLRYWNEIALNAGGLDHTPVATSELRIFGEQLGPVRTARALAIVHIAIFDAVNAIVPRYQSYTGIPRAHSDTSVGAAVAQAAHDTLAALYPSQRSAFDMRLAEDLLRLPDGRAKLNGIDLGRRAAAAILALRANDGLRPVDPVIGVDFFTSDRPGKWRQDPVSLIPIALGAYSGEITPFVLRSSRQFRLPPPPALSSAEYALAFYEVKHLGGDGVITPTMRKADQTVAGIYWAYDGTPGLSAPPRLYNQIAVMIASQKYTDLVNLARLLALVNTAIADTAISLWESKYYYQFWRPVTGIREADPGTGPTGAGDGNPFTRGDPNFTPLGAPASNLSAPNFTPPFPAYASGHAAFGAALFQTLRRFYGTDRISFTFVSDEYNGVTRDNRGVVRPYLPRSFPSLSYAEEENGQSRIYLGIHWAFDKTEGIELGRRVADYMLRNGLVPPRPVRHQRGYGEAQAEY